MTNKLSPAFADMKTFDADISPDSDARAPSDRGGAGAEPFVPEIMQFDPLYARILRATGCATEAELAAFLHVSPAEVTEAVAHERLPAGWITRLLEEHRISPLWVWYGRGPMRFSRRLPAEDSESGVLLEGMLLQCERIYQMMQKIRDMRENDPPSVSAEDGN